MRASAWCARARESTSTAWTARTSRRWCWRRCVSRSAGSPPRQRASRARPAAPPARGPLMPQLTAPDGTALVYDAYEPASPIGAVLFLTGWSDHAGRWVPAATRLRDAGYATFVLDQRGHGR